MPDDLDRRLGETVPRYTSYPTAPHFHTGIGASDVERWVEAIPPSGDISLYLHVPFCDRLCWFCACHTRQTHRYEPVSAYLELLWQEISDMAVRLDGRGRIRALHFGGGSPTMLRPDDLTGLTNHLRWSLDIAADATFSVEIDPNDMDSARLDALVEAGLTRASLGVQDFDPKVQQAINRIQTFDTTARVVNGLRVRGVRAINIDLLYGLPHQTDEGVGETVSRVLELRPDRIALFGYAHVPWFKKHQTMIDAACLPDGRQRLAQSQAAAEMLLAAGYRAIGIDHFALPGDALERASAEGRLYRNFQGYTDDPCQTLIGLGPSSVSRYAQGFAQNHPAMPTYRDAVLAGRMPVARGIVTTAEDRLRGWVIERLMCDFGFDAGELSRRFGPAADRIVAEALDLARREPRMLAVDDGRFVIPQGERVFARTVAARFDPYIGAVQARHSVAV